MNYDRGEHANQLKDGYISAIKKERQDRAGMKMDPSEEFVSNPNREDGFDGITPNLPGGPGGRDISRSKTGVLPDENAVRRDEYMKPDAMLMT